MNEPEYLCPACRTVVNMPVFWIGTQIGRQMVAEHISECDHADTIADELADEIQEFLSTPCTHVRKVGDKVIARCHNTPCVGGFHRMVREDER